MQSTQSKMVFPSKILPSPQDLRQTSMDENAPIKATEKILKDESAKETESRKKNEKQTKKKLHGLYFFS